MQIYFEFFTCTMVYFAEIQFTYYHKYMLFASWEVRIVKNCDRGLENAARGRITYLFFSKQTHGKKTHASVIVNVVRDRKIRTALRTNQIARFGTVPAWKKIHFVICQMTKLVL